MSKKSHRLVLRLTEEHKRALTQLADLSERSVSHIIREMIGFGLKNTHRPKTSRLEKSQLQAVYEAVFILRKLASQVDESIPTLATQEAKALLEKYFDTPTGE